MQAVRWVDDIVFQHRVLGYQTALLTRKMVGVRLISILCSIVPSISVNYFVNPLTRNNS